MAVRYECDWCEQQTTKEGLYRFTWRLQEQASGNVPLQHKSAYAEICAKCRHRSGLYCIALATSMPKFMAPFRAAALAKEEAVSGTNWKTEAVRVLLHNTAATLRQLAKHCDVEGRLSSGEHPKLWFAQTANDLEHVLQQGVPDGN